MRIKTRAFIFIVLCLVAIGGWLFQFGPPTVRLGDYVLLEKVTFSGNQLYLVAHRNTNWVDTYSIFLFCRDKTNQWRVNYLAHEDSYWWGSALKPKPGSAGVKIECFYRPIAIYFQQTGSVYWLANDKSDSTGWPLSSNKFEALDVGLKALLQ